MKDLPIHAILNDLKTTIRTTSTIILQAPPGAGKSTVVPISLLNEIWLEDKIIIMLEPRRVVARMLATQMAKLLGEEVGQSVGYQVKMENCYSKKTKLLVVTEAILVRKLQSDQSLENVAMVIFDEFHERSIHTDLSLALCLQVQELLREDLKLLIMSATLNSNELINLVGEVPVITSQGKIFNVENIYLDENIKQPDFKSINTVLLDVTVEAIKNDTGDILVFLPGVREIKKLQNSLEESLNFKELNTNTIEVLPLYSTLSKEKQDKALLKSKKRKIILSTNISQTSLTIDGVKVVIDSGLEKSSFYNYSTALNQLKLSFISKDSAIQRAGRAGRLSNGKCYRLWHKKKILEESKKPEILKTDLTSFFLDLALWGVENIKELKFLNYPELQVEKSTKKVLQELQMINKNYQITQVGKNALSLGVHPRFAFMILKANDLSFAYEACLLSAILIEKDIFKNSYSNSDIYLRFIPLYERNFEHSYINLNAAKNVLKQSEFFYSKLKAFQKIKKSNIRINEESLSQLLLFAYPDRLAKQRVKGENKYKLSNGKGAILNIEDSLFNEEFLVVASLNAQNKDSQIHSALKISLSSIEKMFLTYIQKKESIIYNKENEKFDIREKEYFFELELSSKPISSVAKFDYSKLILELIKKEGLSILSWNEKAIELKDRVNFVNENMPKQLPNYKDDALLNSLDIWLEPYLNNIKTIKHLKALDLHTVLSAKLSWDEMKTLDNLAPAFVKVPSNSNIKIDYSNSKNPILAVKIQEVFGMSETPKILNNTIALQMHLLSPAQRPIQITNDIKNFWKNSYDEVRKELCGKYKKHYWPINPFDAIATNKTKKYM